MPFTMGLADLAGRLYGHVVDGHMIHGRVIHGRVVDGRGVDVVDGRVVDGRMAVSMCDGHVESAHVDRVVQRKVQNLFFEQKQSKRKPE